VKFTSTVQETPRIDFGTQLARAYLLSGWSPTPPVGMTEALKGVMYVHGRQARAFFHLAAIAQRTLSLRCGLVQGRRERVRGRLRINGRLVWRGTFGPEMEEITALLPLDCQRKGRNVLQLEVSLANPASPSTAKELGLPLSALACSELRLEGESVNESVSRLIEFGGGRRLLLPAGSSAEFHVSGGERVRLVVEAASVDADAVLRIDQADPNGGTRTRCEGRPPSRGIELDGHPGEVSRIRLIAAGRADIRIDRLSLERTLLRRRGGAKRIGKSSVILYVVDTLRADRLGCYGYERPLSPNIDALARESVLFADAQAQASWTRPSVASILSGLEPLHHGATQIDLQIAGNPATLASELRRRRYATAAFVTNLNVAPRWGFARGFDVYRYLEEDESVREIFQRAATVHEHALDWLKQVNDRPFFLYVHASDPHEPYTPDEEYA